MIDLFCHPQTTVLVASVSVQELYGEKSNWLTQFENCAEEISLNRNFRNPGPVGRLAHIFYEIALDIDQITTTKIPRNLLYPKLPQKKSDLNVSFDRFLGEFPKLVPVEYPNSYDDLPHEIYLDLLTQEYKKIIQSQIISLTKEDSPIDILILVPTESSNEKTAVVKALQSLNSSFIDYTNTKNRRSIAQPEMIRVCTFHSSRGIEGKKVIIIGCENIKSLSESTRVNFKNLGYIIFLRSVIDCIICVRTVDNNLKSPIISFTEDVLTILKRNYES
jgi:hypothetical protein